MNIALLSDKWKSSSKNGVSIAASMHAKLIEELGYKLIVIGSSDKIKHEDLLTKNKFWVYAGVTKSIFSKVNVDIKLIEKILVEQDVDLLIIEGWQTQLTDTAVEVGYSLKIPVVMISHGISLHPFTICMRDLFRSLLWCKYRFIRFPRLLNMLSGLSVLDFDAQSNRFYDRDIAIKNKKIIYKLVNTPHHISTRVRNREDRLPQIVVVGYFSYVKNQLTALRILKKLDANIKIKFIGEKSGKYYKKCIRYTVKNNLIDRVIFSSDLECSISEEISKSILALSTSITEVQPLFLLEAMASGTPFISYNVGAVSKMVGGECCDNEDDLLKKISKLLNDRDSWNRYSSLGVRQIEDDFNKEKVKSQLKEIIGNHIHGK